MKALILAAGLGSRLRPLTNRIPKALVPVAGRPLLERTIQTLRDAGASEIVVNVHHLGDQIIDYLSNHDYGIPIRISDERECLLNTGGGLRKALPLFTDTSEPILIHNVDILSNVSLPLFYQNNKDNDATLLISSRKTYRYLLFNDEKQLVGWLNSETGEVKSPYPHLDITQCHKFAFAGIHLFSPRLLPLMQTLPERFSIIDFYLNHCNKANIRGYFKSDLQLLDVGKQETLSAAETFLQQLATDQSKTK